MLFFLGALLEFGGRPGLTGLRDWLAAWRPPRLDKPDQVLPLLALITIVAVGAFFGLYDLDDTPSEMISDHAEKALDIETVLNGEFPVYFPRNTGREISQMYMAAGRRTYWRSSWVTSVGTKSSLRLKKHQNIPASPARSCTFFTRMPTRR